MICFFSVFALLITASRQQSVRYDFNIQKAPQGFSLFYTFLATEQICLGTPYQCIPIQFDPATSLTVILDSNYEIATVNANRYNKSLSQTFLDDKHSSDSFSSQKLINGFLSSDTLSFGPLVMANSTFFLAREWISELEYSSIGLSALTNDVIFPNFISKLHQVSLITDHRYLLLCDYDNSIGKVFLGNYTSSITEKKLFELKFKRYFVAMYFKVKKLLFENVQLDTEYYLMETVFDETFRFVQMPLMMKERVYQLYLNNSNCEEMVYTPERRGENDITYVYYLCSKGLVNEEAFDNITFRYEEGELLLRKEDFFERYDSERVIFNIVFKSGSFDPLWVIGHPILKHYVISRDLDNDYFTFYLNERNSTSFRHSMMILTSLIMFNGVVFIFSFRTVFLRKDLIIFKAISQ